MNLQSHITFFFNPYCDDSFLPTFKSKADVPDRRIDSPGRLVPLLGCWTGWRQKNVVDFENRRPANNCKMNDSSFSILEADFEVRDILHSERDSMSDNDCTYAVHSVNL